MIGDGFDQVLLAARRGDEWAWSALYRDMSPVLLGWLRSQRAPQPEDVTAEVLLQVVRDLSQFAGDEGAFRSWVFTIARNRTIDQRRQDQRRPADATEDERLARVVEPDDDSALLAVEAMTTDELVDLIERLSPAEAEVLSLRYLADLSQREVAAVTGRNLNSVKQAQKRGLRSLRALVAATSYPFADGATLSDM